MMPYGYYRTSQAASEAEKFLKAWSAETDENTQRISETEDSVINKILSITRRVFCR